MCYDNLYLQAVTKEEFTGLNTVSTSHLLFILSKLKSFSEQWAPHQRPERRAAPPQRHSWKKISPNKPQFDGQLISLKCSAETPQLSTLQIEKKGFMFVFILKGSLLMSAPS